MREKREPKHPNMQDLMLDLIEQGSFNSFNGHQVHDDLVNNNELWDAASMYPDCPGLFIRDLPGGSFHADRLYILTDRKRWKKLRPIIESWCPTAVIKTDRKGTKCSSRWDSQEDDKLKFVKSEKQDVGSLLGSWPAGVRGKNDKRVVLNIWWD